MARFVQPERCGRAVGHRLTLPSTLLPLPLPTGTLTPTTPRTFTSATGGASRSHINLSASPNVWSLHPVSSPPSLASESIRPPSISTNSSLPIAAPTLSDGPRLFKFNEPIESVEICTPKVITWTYSGPDADIALSIAATPELHVEPDLPFMPLAAGIDAGQGVFAWESVKYPSGWYVLRASGSTVWAQSIPFPIYVGKDVSCLKNYTSSTFSSTTSPVQSLVTGPNAANTRITTAAPSVAPSAPSAAKSTSGTVRGNKRASVIAGGVIAGIAILGVAILAGICIRHSLCRRSRRSSAPRTRRTCRSGRWVGLSSSDINEESECGAPMDEPPSLPASTEKRASVTSRLEPNRRRPSMLFPEMATLDPLPPPGRDTLRLSTNRLSVPIVETRRGDSPTLPVSPYRTRKPVPPLDPLDDAPRTKQPPTPSRGSQTTGFPSLNSPVSSSATSAMYRTRESAMSSTRTRPYGDGEESSVARASSVIDPGQFGAMKTMYSLVPDVPPLPQS
ncbi:hypothetical protein BV20DRAFT_1035375 [Pilatotrama ljubarskyi]|nr:hypothetical protein BV20DRAFT_1035375 [Pilatotrama ljubarskyi]